MLRLNISIFDLVCSMRAISNNPQFEINKLLMKPIMKGSWKVSNLLWDNGHQSPQENRTDKEINMMFWGRY